MTTDRKWIYVMTLFVLTMLLPYAVPPLLRAAAIEVSVPLPGSFQPVDTTHPTAAEPHKAFISRSTLQPGEKAKTLNFEVTLQMRNFTELQQRVVKGEQISKPEMESKYRPLAQDYQNIVAWLEQQGFAILRQDPNRMAVFASGKIEQLQNKLSVKFARVTADGADYTSAISAPFVPARLASAIVGINGLQPHIRPHRHAIRLDSTSGAGAPYEPSQLAQAYDASSLYASGINGSGQTIAIVIDCFPLMSDLNTFWSNYGVDRGSSTVTFVQAVAGALPSPSGEETLDTEWSSSIAPGANVRVYATKDLAYVDIDQGYEQVYEDVMNSPTLAINQMSMSFGAAEHYVSGSQLTADDQYFAELAAAGVTIFASSGDEGAAPTESGAGGGRHLTPESPASDPNVTGVGGTSLTVDATGAESSEVVWNNPYKSNGNGASGGGISGYFSKPSWQTGPTLPSSTQRLVPDVSCSANPVNGAYVILNGQAYQYGGTSWSSPTWAGFCALLNQSRVAVKLSTIGILGPYLYPLVGSPNFRDITSGNNAYEGSGGYNAGMGYDLATGCGSPDVAVLAQTLTASAVKATVPNLLSVASVQSQGGINFPLDLPLTGNEGVECRIVKGSLQIVFTFDGTITSGTAQVTAGTANVAGTSFNGDAMTVNLTGANNAQNFTIEITGINGTNGSAGIAFGLLQGDVNGDGAVNILDLGQIRLHSGETLNATNFRYDINEDGAINILDLGQTRLSSGTSLP